MKATLVKEEYTVPHQLKDYIKNNTLIIRSPGRINLIGEHTDYNDGYVLPAAIDKAAYIAITPRSDRKINLQSIDMNDSFNTTLDELKINTTKSWPNYLLGVVDCRSLEYEYEPLQMEGYKIVLFDSNVKHSLASTEYNVRRKQCETGVAMIQQHLHEVKSLRDVTMEMLDKYVLPQDIMVYQRCKYVVEENNRLLEGCKDLEANDLVAFGKKMFETHHGLSKLYEVRCPELDFLVTQVQDNPAVVGARMMGGGFGGCTINIVKEEAVCDLIKHTTTVYNASMQKELKAYIVNIEDGSSVIK